MNTWLFANASIEPRHCRAGRKPGAAFEASAWVPASAGTTGKGRVDIISTVLSSSSSFRRRPESRNPSATFFKTGKTFSSLSIPNEAALRLHSRQSEKRNTLCRSDFRCGAARLAAQARPGRGIHQKIRCSYAGLVRAPCNDGICHLSRESDQGMAAGLENKAHRINQPAMARSLQRDCVIRHSGAGRKPGAAFEASFWVPASAGTTSEKQRHSGAGRNPGTAFEASHWVPAFAGTTSEKQRHSGAGRKPGTAFEASSWVPASAGTTTSRRVP